MDYQRVLRGSLAIPMRHHLTTVPLARLWDGGGWRVGISRTVRAVSAVAQEEVGRVRRACLGNWEAFRPAGRP